MFLLGLGFRVSGFPEPQKYVKKNNAFWAIIGLGPLFYLFLGPGRVLGLEFRDSEEGSVIIGCKTPQSVSSMPPPSKSYLVYWC